MLIRFYIDDETDRPHVENHGVTTSECVEVLERPGQDFATQSGARAAYGQTRAGMYLKVIYRLIEEHDEVFVITAYRLKGKDLAAFKRRMKRRGKR